MKKVIPVAILIVLAFVVSCGEKSSKASSQQQKREYNTWYPISTAGAPTEYVSTPIWTGTEVIAWPGGNSRGARYDPLTDTWKPMSMTNIPKQVGHSSVWTGNEMIIWGGCAGDYCYSNNRTNSGGKYNPTTDTWTQPQGLPGNCPLNPRVWHTAVWTGTQMIVWGGYASGNYLNTGGAYDPIADSWKEISNYGAPSTGLALSVWTGKEMIIWPMNLYYSKTPPKGGKYNPSEDRWEQISDSVIPDSMVWYTAVWAGTEMIVWGMDNTGGRYDPVTNSWVKLTSVGHISGYQWCDSVYGSTAIWTGKEMIVWGGDCLIYLQSSQLSATALKPTYYDIRRYGFSYNPSSNTFKELPQTNMPDFDSLSSVVWTGTEMIVWEKGTKGVGGRFMPE
jgi:hypothetical protein